MSLIETILQQQKLIILDGALATELERRGCDLRDPLWSAKMLIEHPALIRQIHADYLAAGADVVITANYQATFAGLAVRGMSGVQAVELMRLAVQLALEARDAFWAEPRNRVGRVRPLVAASIGPYGAFLHDGSEYRGDYGLSIVDLKVFHRPRLAVLASAGADLLACETIPCLVEAQALAELLSEFPTTPAWFSFSARNGSEISNGEAIAHCAAAFDHHPQLVALGVNCTPPAYIESLIHAARSSTSKPIVVYPNSGEVWDATDSTWSGEASCSDFAAQARTWYAAGAQLIGGCCRTTPQHIASLRQLFQIVDFRL
ncbi:homocysteine S-methyltransferase [Candidatus Viridilinea mediisalina]|uniref:S-methylmethionine:homocysteine methyltransferase n=1 Tax=Candidatus Viridilinea mediisalina TaxID=2024553 RepID=A0A2A6REX7_9CHLR|nr:homocysteine S-methyltransferase [Candidatus Viridilinea mediisalina]PDW01684.1 homocysteine S-methyltransferase [Candidatus Viridilinea mediisalina]